MATPRVALYLRVSTQDQSCDLQREELVAYCEARGWKIHKIYEDKSTGTNTNRPEFQQMLRDAQLRRFDTLCTWKLDRFARSLKDLVNHLQDLSEYGVTFVSLKDHLDLTTSSGRLMMHMIGAFSEFEASLIRSRVRSGIATAKAKGIRFGRPPTLNHDRIRALKDQGMTVTEISEALSTSKSAVSKVLKKFKPKTA